MRLNSILGALSVGAVLVLTGCGSSSNSNSSTSSTSSSSSSGTASKQLSYLNAMGTSFKQDMHGLNDIWKDANSSRTVAFKALGNQEALAEIIQGSVDIADEVGNSKMAAPFGVDGTQDVTKVESQFSWNSTNDFYNNISSISKVWNNGLSAIATAHGIGVGIDAQITDTLASIAAISDLVVADTLAGTYLIPQDKAFRNQMIGVDDDEDGNVDNPESDVTSSRGKIRTAIDNCIALQGQFETLKTEAAGVTLTAADKTNIDKIVDDVIRTGYATMITGVDALATALATLKATPTAANVTAARTAWRKPRAAWESSEAYIVATAPTVGDATDGNVDSWPVPTRADIVNNLNAWDGTDVQVIGTDGDKKGFHGIEFFLFGDGEVEESATDAATRLQN